MSSSKVYLYISVLLVTKFTFPFISFFMATQCTIYHSHISLEQGLLSLFLSFFFLRTIGWIALKRWSPEDES